MYDYLIYSRHNKKIIRTMLLKGLRKVKEGKKECVYSTPLGYSMCKTYMFSLSSVSFSLFSASPFLLSAAVSS